MNKQEEKGIWRFREWFPSIPAKFHLTLGEGNTNLKKVDNIYFKCEYENPTGSVKDRGMAYQVSRLLEKEIRSAVISSSGNAAISAANLCRLGKIKLTVFVSPKINKKKLKLLQKLDFQIIQTQKPVSASVRYARENDVYNLRQSTDANASLGYETIAYELNEQKPKADAIFIPVSSGTTLVGIASGFSRLNQQPAIHAVQTEKVYPIASLFDREFTPKKKSLADAIVAKYTPRQDEIVEIIKKSKGNAWVISDKEMTIAKKWLTSHSLNCSHEGAAVLAALWKAKKKGYNYENPVCILTGRDY